MSNEEQHQEDEFDAAFSEAAEETEAAEDGGDAEQDTDTTTDESEAAGDGEGETDGDEDWRAKAEAERQAREEVEQKMRSWDGRLRKSNEELARERGARKALEQRLSALEQHGKEGDRKKLQEWLDDYGDDEEFAHITAVVRDRLSGAEESNTGESVVEGDDEAAGQEVDEEAKAHFSAIEEKHSDWRELADDLDNWIETLPGKQALEYARVKQHGTAQEVIAMLDAMKADKQGDGKRDDVTDGADAMAAVRHRSSGKRPKGRADKNDFDGAWSEAVGQD